MSTSIRFRRASAVTALVMGLVLLLLGGRADAHGRLASTEPAAGSTVRQLDRVVLRFEEPIESAGAHLWLESDDGLMPLGPVVHPDGDGRALSAPVPPVASSRYTLGYHVVGDDGDVAVGSVPFTFDRPAVGAEGAATDDPPAPPITSAPIIAASEPQPTSHRHSAATDLPAGVARVLLDAALASLVGGFAFVSTVWPQGAGHPRTRRLLWCAAVVGALASFVLAVVQHAAASQLGIVAALGPRHVLASLQFRFGRIAALRVALLASAAALSGALGRGGPRTARSIRWCVAATAVAMGLFETIALLGHTGRAGAMAETARFVHTLGVSVWLGGLVMLVVVVPRRSDELLDLLPRFSILATAAVGAVVLAGIALSVDLVGVAGALPTTGYGRVLLLKTVVVAMLLVVAARARRFVHDRLRHATTTRQRRAVVGPVTTLVGIELGLIAVVLALTALLVSQAPPA